METLASSNAASWNIAARRVAAWLQSHRPNDEEAVLRNTLEIIAIARESMARGENGEPLGIAMRIASARVDTWYEMIGRKAGVPPESAVKQARVAARSGDVFGRWPGVFLTQDPPADFVHAIRTAYRMTLPNLELSRLPRKEVDFGPFEDLARETWGKFSWGFVIRAFFLWAAIFILSYHAWNVYHP